MADGQSATLEQELGDLLDQERFDPPEDFASAALISDLSEHEKAAEDFQGWWAEQARALHWFTDFEEVLDDSDPPFYKWFKDGTLNASYNCLDRHVENGLASASPSTGGARRARSATSPTTSCCATSSASPTP
jgi:acetyl-CoA synthetase